MVRMLKPYQHKLTFCFGMLVLLLWSGILEAQSRNGYGRAVRNKFTSLNPYKIGQFDSAIADFTKVLEIDSGTERMDRERVEDAQQHAAQMLQQQHQQQQQQQQQQAQKGEHGEQARGAIPAKALMDSLGQGQGLTPSQQGWLEERRGEERRGEFRMCRSCVHLVVHCITLMEHGLLRAPPSHLRRYMNPLSLVM